MRPNTAQLLEQNVVWITSDGMPIKLDEMDPEHRRYTLAFLRRRSRFLMKAYDWCLLQAWSHGEHFGMNDDTLELSDDPDVWLERRPLVIELARMVDKDNRGPVIDAEFYEADARAIDRRHRAIEAAARTQGPGSAPRTRKE